MLTMGKKGSNLMTKQRKNHTKSLKIEVTIKAIEGKLTLAQIASKYGIHSSQVKDWKKMGVRAIREAFSNQAKRDDEREAERLALIGQLTVENQYLKKKLSK